jgi:hypothetical protein
MKKYWWLVLIILAIAIYLLTRPALAPEIPADNFVGPSNQPFVKGPNTPPPGN